MYKHWVYGMANIPLKKKYAQFGEENLFDYIFDNIGTQNKFIVDFGAGTLNSGLSNSRYLIEKGWNGLLMDGNPKEKNEIIKQEFITAENIVGLLDKYKVPEDFDFLSIDIDGNDFWVLKSILESKYTPRLIVNEFNGCLPNGHLQVMKYNPNHSWMENDYYGASFDAFKHLLNEAGYTLVFQIASTNMFFIKTELVNLSYFKVKDFGVNYTQTQYHPHAPNKKWLYFNKGSKILKK